MESTYSRLCAALKIARKACPQGRRIVLRLETPEGKGYFMSGAATLVQRAAYRAARDADECGPDFDPYTPAGPDGDGCFASSKGAPGYPRSWHCGVTGLGQLRHWFRFRYLAALVPTSTAFSIYSVPEHDVFEGRTQVVFLPRNKELLARVEISL